MYIFFSLVRTPEQTQHQSAAYTSFLYFIFVFVPLVILNTRSARYSERVFHEHTARVSRCQEYDDEIVSDARADSGLGEKR